ncbi:MAG: hypothetical protein KGO02_19225 [Alphaproteobacteria bacterium]|nr:hypothetical protein [Alphaproteobacteria bacterium]
MMIGFRVLALCLIVFALLFLGADALSSLQHGTIRLHSLAQLLDAAAPHAAHGIRTWAADVLPGPLARLVHGLLASWAWALFGVAGVLIAFVSGRPRLRA